MRREDAQFHIHLQDGTLLHADKILLATGSMPNGYTLAQSLGHSIVDPVPSLFTFNCQHFLLNNLMGTSFPKASLTLSIPVGTRHKTWHQSGPLLITHWGLSGPAVLKLSAFAARELHATQYQAQLTINWLGDRDQDSVFDFLNAWKDANPQQSLSNAAIFELSKRFLAQFFAFALAERSPSTTWQELTKADLREIAHTLCHTKIAVTGKGIFKEEFVTCGGIDLKEVDFKTMQSKICPGLFFAGEILNLDGITGGFNFQGAWTTGWIAAQAMSLDNL